jgi:hypothetical protein
MSTAARRLNEIVQRGLSIVQNHQEMLELHLNLWHNFPFLGKLSQSSRLGTVLDREARIVEFTARKWKATPCLLNLPELTRVSTQDQMDRLSMQEGSGYVMV